MSSPDEVIDINRDFRANLCEITSKWCEVRRMQNDPVLKRVTRNFS
jgi:hypothetical protein